MHRVDAGARGKQHAGQMRRRAGAGAADRDAVRPRLGEGDELLERLGLHVGGRDHGDVRHLIGERRRDQVLLGDERHLGDQELVDREVPDRRGADGVAVRRALRDHVDADIARCAGLVLDHHRLAELVLQRFGENAEQHVGRAARRVGHDHANLTGRASCLARAPARRRSRRGRCGAAQQGAPRDGMAMHCSFQSSRILPEV